MNSLVSKVALFVVWPFFAAFLLFSVSVVLVCAWPIILFGTWRKGKDGKWSLKFDSEPSD